jgi:catechol 2,3-dioxygenase-like lactoylglutathione lyase family enzyme
VTEHDHADPDAAGQLHHVEVAVPPDELDAALDWWGWLLDELGYAEKNDWAGGRSWILGPTYVVLKAADEAGTVERRAPGLDHLAFHAGSREQVDRIAERCRSDDATELLYPDRHPRAGGYYAAYVQGPAGTTVEMVGPEPS